MNVQIYGVDPGLVDTGIVLLNFNKAKRRVVIGATVITRATPYAVAGAVGTNYATFIEAYRPRSNFNSDARMVTLVADIHKALPGSKVLPNTGVKKVVRESLLRILHCWGFSKRSNHDDLRSAARIAILGMMKEPELNELLADFVRDYCEGRPWDVLD